MALGRGLGAILEEVSEAYETGMLDTDDIVSIDTDETVSDLDISLIDPNPYQPRKIFDEKKLEELSESIKQHGLLQPVVVVSMNDRYILVAGERRLRAHKLANMSSIKSIIVDIDYDEIKMRELALIENIQREDLNPIELAQSYQELLNVHNITHEELSSIVHKSRSQITNTLRLLALDKYVIEALSENKITQGHAKIMVNLEPKRQIILVDTIIGQKLSVRDAEKYVKSVKDKKSIKNKISEHFAIPKDKKIIIDNLLPLKHKFSNNKIEIMLQNEEELIKFITFLENK